MKKSPASLARACKSESMFCHLLCSHKPFVGPLKTPDTDTDTEGQNGQNLIVPLHVRNRVLKTHKSGPFLLLTDGRIKRLLL